MLCSDVSCVLQYGASPTVLCQEDCSWSHTVTCEPRVCPVFVAHIRFFCFSPALADVGCLYACVLFGA